MGLGKTGVMGLVLGLMLLGCTEDAGTSTASSGDLCAQQGGQTVQGLNGPACAKPTPDAGKSCNKPSDCTGYCMAQTMTCSAQTPQFGCFDIVIEGGNTIGLCVD